MGFPGVQKDQGGHVFGDGDDARDDARIVAAVDFDVSVSTLLVDGLLGFGDRRGWLDTNSNDNSLAVGDPTGDAAGVIGQETAVAHAVVGLTTTHPRQGIAITDLQGLGSPQAQ